MKLLKRTSFGNFIIPPLKISTSELPEEEIVVSLNKHSGKTLVERCVQPADLATLSDANLLCGMLGTRSYRNFPIWGRMENDCLAQVITPYELSLYKETNKITIPDALQGVGEDDNPIVILYHLK